MVGRPVSETYTDSIPRISNCAGWTSRSLHSVSPVEEFCCRPCPAAMVGLDQLFHRADAVFAHGGDKVAKFRFEVIECLMLAKPDGVQSRVRLGNRRHVFGVPRCSHDR